MNDIDSFLSKLRFWKIAGLSFFLGLLLATTFAPLHFIFFLPVAFSGLLILLKTAKTKWQAFFVGWWFGWGQFIAGLYWIGVAFTIDAQAHAALIPIPTMALPAFLAIFSGIATLVTFLIKGQGISRILIFTGIWVLCEYIRGIIFTGFPWNLAGYSWGGILPMLQWTAFIGIYGLTLITVLISSLPAILADRSISRWGKNASVLVSCGLLGVMVIIGYVRLSNNTLSELPDSQIRIVQPNIPQQDKWKPDLRFAHVKNLTELSAQNTPTKPRYLIWPETAIPFFLTTDENLRTYLQRIVPKEGALITGAPRKDPVKKRYWNSVQVLHPTGDVGSIYDKRHLLPYGEYMPLRSFLEATGIASLIPALDQMSDFSFPENKTAKTIEILGLPPARVLICYEIIFPWEVQSETPFNWILNVTNDGWFGNTSGPFQHLVISQARAIEQGMSVIRAANTGVSAIINGYGQIESKIGLNERGVLDGVIPGPVEGGTFYKRTGEIAPIILTFLVLGAGLLGRWRKRDQPAS